MYLAVRPPHRRGRSCRRLLWGWVVRVAWSNPGRVCEASRGHATAAGHEQYIYIYIVLLVLVLLLLLLLLILWSISFISIVILIVTSIGSIIPAVFKHICYVWKYAPTFSKSWQTTHCHKWYNNNAGPVFVLGFDLFFNFENF